MRYLLERSGVEIDESDASFYPELDICPQDSNCSHSQGPCFDYEAKNCAIRRMQRTLAKYES